MRKILVEWSTDGVIYVAICIDADKGIFDVDASNNTKTMQYNFYTCLTACCSENSWEVAKKLMSLLTDEEKKV
jgi:hypothetical protein